MTFRTRILARVGAITLLAAGALATAGAPALAAPADADLALTVTGLTVAADATGKHAVATVSNKSPRGTATGVTIIFDLSSVDTEKVALVLPDDPGVCESHSDDPQIFLCGVADLPAGANADLAFRLTNKGGASGSAGTFVVGVAHDGQDLNEGNNNFRHENLTVGDNGPDLYAFAWDVPLKADGSYGTVAPGGTAPLKFIVGNQGDRAVTGFKVTVTLPAGATFGGSVEGCTYAADNRSAVCEYTKLPIVPVDDEEDADADPAKQEPPFSLYGFEMPITVDANAKVGVNLTDGVVDVVSTGVVRRPQALRNKAFTLPRGVTGLTELPADVDPTDNTDEFSVFVGAPSDNGGGGGGGGLPITGSPTALLGGAGLAALLLGGMLFLLARRRRVVLVTPGDEK
jgi:hypothetical protein